MTKETALQKAIRMSNPNKMDMDPRAQHEVRLNGCVKFPVQNGMIISVAADGGDVELEGADGTVLGVFDRSQYSTLDGIVAAKKLAEMLASVPVDDKPAQIYVWASQTLKDYQNGVIIGVGKTVAEARANARTGVLSMRDGIYESLADGIDNDLTQEPFYIGNGWGMVGSS